MSVGGATNREQATFNNDVRLRLDVVEQSGIAISDPVQTFTAVAATAGHGAQVTFKIHQVQGIDRIEVLRNASGDYSTAQILASYPASTVALQQPTGPNDSSVFSTGTKLWYWLRSIPIQSKFQPIIHGPIKVTVP